MPSPTRTTGPGESTSDELKDDPVSTSKGLKDFLKSLSCVQDQRKQLRMNLQNTLQSASASTTEHSKQKSGDCAQ